MTGAQQPPPRASAGTPSDVHVLSSGALTLEVDAALGARVTAFCLGGHNVLAGADAHPDNFGSTFWTSPQTDWGWPPVVALDSAPYVVQRDGDAALTMVGPVASLLGVSVEKRFAVLAAQGGFALEYRIHSARPAPVRVAPWEVTRVPPGGLTFFPTGAGVYPPSNLTVVEAGGATWFAYERERIAGHPKLFADAGAGWLAHVDRDTRTLFVKTFPAVPRAQQAPGEALIEIYAHPAFTYVELEQQGAMSTIVAGAPLVWPVTWHLHRLPEDVTVAAGSPSLLAYVRSVLAGDR